MKTSLHKSMGLRFLQLVKYLLLLLVALVGIGIVIKSVDYYTPDFSRGYLSDKKNIFDGIFKYGLYAHIITIPIIFLIGTIQAFFRYEMRYPKIHRAAGNIYVYAILFVSFPGALILSFYAFGGLPSIISFVTLSILWAYCTYKGWYYGKRKMLSEHKKFMIRSYVLTTSAIMLRILSFISVHYFYFYGGNAYSIISWTSWMPAIMITELLFYKNKKSFNY